MKALSIKQPWAWLICAGYKDVENRSWKIGRKSRHGMYSTVDVHDFKIELPCRIYVHAGKGKDTKAIKSIIDCENPNFNHDAYAEIYRMEADDKWWLGSIIGEVDIVGCTELCTSVWATDSKYHFLLKNPVLYDKPIPYKGTLGFFTPVFSTPDKREG